MINDLKILGLIPARGGSKGISRKNVRLIKGKPVIAYTIEAALKSSYIDDVVVTTDDEEIAKVSREYGAEVPFMRPASLASDTAKTVDAVVHAIQELKKQGKNFDVLVLLQPTSPLRTTQHIDEALTLFIREGRQSVVGVQEAENHPLLMRTMKQGKLHPMLNQCSTVRRQDMDTFYVVNGAIYINNVDEITENTSFNDNVIGYVMPKMVDLDTQEDLDYMQYLMSL